MGKRGPKPKPMHLRALEGSRMRVPVDPDLIVIGSELPPAKPLSVQDDPWQSHEWDRLIAATPPDLYNALDSAILTVYVESLSLKRAAQEDILDRGHYVEVEKPSKSGELYTVTEVNPSIGIWKTATETLLKCVDRLGMTPSARVRLQIPRSGDKPQSKFGDLLTQRRLPAP